MTLLSWQNAVEDMSANKMKPVVDCIVESQWRMNTCCVCVLLWAV